MNNLIEILNKLIENIPNLGFNESVHVANFSGAIVIFIYLISIVMITYSNQLIDYFDLENKYPKLAKYLQYRRKLYNIYFIRDVLIIASVCCLLIFVNLIGLGFI